METLFYSMGALFLGYEIAWLFDYKKQSKLNYEFLELLTNLELITNDENNKKRVKVFSNKYKYQILWQVVSLLSLGWVTVGLLTVHWELFAILGVIGFATTYTSKYLRKKKSLKGYTILSLINTLIGVFMLSLILLTKYNILENY